MSGHTKENLRACITALLADEESGCSRRHLDDLLESLAHTSQHHEELLESLRWITRCASTSGPAGTTMYFISDAFMRRAERAVENAEARSLV